MVKSDVVFIVDVVPTASRREQEPTMHLESHF